MPSRPRAAAGRLCAMLLVGGILCGEQAAVARQPNDPAQPGRPNFVILLADDLGYGDLGCFGAKDIPTPNLDRLAAEGLRLTSFCVPQATCSPSRAGLLTGCYPNRIGITGSLMPHSPVGLAADQLTIPALLKSQGYATALVGKWHLGDRAAFLPTRHGFDVFFGLPYGHDLRSPDSATKAPGSVALPLYEGERIVEINPDLRTLTGRYTRRAAAFMEEHGDRPFFLLVAYHKPQIPLYVDARFRHTTDRGLYGDAVAELDGSVGEIMDRIRQLDLDRRTMVLFTSDNGPWLTYGNRAGSAGPLREGKATAFEGGVRVPCIVRWPGRIPAGAVSGELTSTIDLLPTIARIAGARLPRGRIIDGKDLWPLLSRPQATASPHKVFYYYCGNALHAVRSGHWKLHFAYGYNSPVNAPGADGRPGRLVWRRMETSLFNLADDPGETTDVAADFPDVVAYLQTLGEEAREELGDTLTARNPGEAHE